MPSFARPDMLVSTQWVADHQGNTDSIRLVECDEDLLLYETGHLTGAVKLDWVNDLQSQVVRDYVGPDAFGRLCAARGISNDTTVVFYGDKSNWWACYALWVFRLYGHDESRLKIMDGGRAKWLAEGRPITKDRPLFPRGSYTAQPADLSIRAFRDEVLQAIEERTPMVDVRSPAEYSGELTHMPEYPQEGAMRGGHIPGAHNVPWSKAVNEDGTFKNAAELSALYAEAGFAADKDAIVYCRIGERSSHTWFALRYLLGFEKIKNYDGSWSEWGNLVAVPVARGATPGTPRER
jgi:thiosulfate/3-mercaptopyruvate sulfurtransferase